MPCISQGKTIANPQLLSFMNLWSRIVAKLNAEVLAAALGFLLEILTFSNSGHIFLALSLVQEEFLWDQVVS